MKLIQKNIKKMSAFKKRKLLGYLFILPAVVLICWMSFYPMLKAFFTSFQAGMGNNLHWAGLYNYKNLLSDQVFGQSLYNTFIYLIIQMPLMIFLAIVLADILNRTELKFKGLFRTGIFLPCALSLVSYSIIFRSIFSNDGLANQILTSIGAIDTNISWLNNDSTARAVIIIALLWRWTGYNMVLFLAGIQGIDGSIYEAAILDGATGFKRLRYITIPLLKPIILVATIMSTNGTLQMFDESLNLTAGGPGNATITLSHYIYKLCFMFSPSIGYAAAVSFVILIIVAALAYIQMKVGDNR